MRVPHRVRQWNEEIGTELAGNIGIEMTDRRWELIRWLRGTSKEKNETRHHRRVNSGRFPTKEQFQLFPQETGSQRWPTWPDCPSRTGCV